MASVYTNRLHRTLNLVCFDAVNLEYDFWIRAAEGLAVLKNSNIKELRETTGIER